METNTAETNLVETNSEDNNLVEIDLVEINSVEINSVEINRHIKYGEKQQSFAPIVRLALVLFGVKLLRYSKFEESSVLGPEVDPN